MAEVKVTWSCCTVFTNRILGGAPTCCVLFCLHMGRAGLLSKGKNPTRTSEHRHSRLSFLPLKDPSLERNLHCSILKTQQTTMGSEGRRTYPFMCMGSEHHQHSWCQQRPEGVSAALGLDLQTVVSHHVSGHWEPNHCSLEEQPVLLVTEPTC